MTIERNIPLSQICNFYIDEAKLTSADFRRLWTLAFRGLVDMGFNTLWQPKTIRIALNDNKTADLPADFMNWVKIGVFNSYGEIATLTVNNNLSTYKDLHENRLTSIAADVTTPDMLAGSPYYFNYFFDGTYRSLYGVPAGLLTPGSCRVDTQNEVILFDPNFQYDYVVLEYISSPQEDDDFSIDVRFQEAMISWLRWKDVQSNKSVNLGEKRSREKAYYNDLSRCKKYLKPFRLQEAEQMLRENSNLKLKA